MKTVIFEVDDKYASVVTATFAGASPSWGSTEINVTCTVKEILGDCTKVVIDENGSVVKDEKETE
jgi:hypothetical protein